MGGDGRARRLMGVKVEQVMCPDVVTVSPAAPLKEVAGVLLEHGISGVPVVDDLGHVLGVVSEADIVFKEQGSVPAGTRRFPWLFRPDESGAARRDAVLASEAMTQPAVTVEPHRSIADAARLMVEHGVKRLPVVHDGLLVGIVTRADFVRAFARDDAELKREIRDDVLLHALWIDPALVKVTVSGGQVELEGRVETRTQAELVAAYVARVPGVVSVDDAALSWAYDDLERRREPHGTRPSI